MTRVNSRSSDRPRPADVSTAAADATAGSTAAATTAAEPAADPGTSAAPAGSPVPVPAEFVPRHIAVVMDGNGRWAQQRGLERTEGHRRGEAALMRIVDECLDLGVDYLSAYAFSTENWRRSAQEVRFLMGFNREVLRRRRDELDRKGVRVRWVGRRPRLWRSVISELCRAEEQTKDNTRLTLAMCLNYGGRAEITDAARALAEDVRAGDLRPADITQDVFARYLAEPDMPDVDLFLRPSGEMRTSNFLPWQSVYAEMVYQDVLFPDYTGAHLREAVLEFARRDRRFGGVEK
ncbi:isoprenyl transferase [Corynebacterium bovis]|uniref:Isoprenyl transferase n=6 Tax=Corynebacterium bovis TaxID=36808 RepID=A0A3R8PJT0_9CORY|nr:isoprenyl transferase [Corynebacterium bovis]RRO92066.1 isoprenyl transferase [Corynebacterium bovis]RRO99486.1 isoprenyl transferase [Corynebacterium bovis]RRQ00276.1 isoprenyl transferase [Corynebacterium bovis]RRQ01469.1 isoprenyl transferase [Corynebacterium bovis]RRQ03372.1 isoprenyl transferase [Corynebacterium bovis]